jgi:hypothetical protein
VLHLSRTPIGVRRPADAPTADAQLVRARPAWATGAYAISRRGAARLLGWCALMWAPVDVQLAGVVAATPWLQERHGQRLHAYYFTSPPLAERTEGAGQTPSGRKSDTQAIQ